MKAGFLQFQPVFGDKKTNAEKLSALASSVKADLLVLPELCLTGYQFRDKEELREYAEPLPGGESIEVFTGLAKTIGGSIVAGIAELDGEKVFNSAVLVGPGGYQAKYRKIHLFDREKEIFDKGDNPLEIFKVGDANVGIMVCFDWIFPEMTRSLALMGADVIAHSSNLVLPYCQKTMPGRAIENRIYIITSNRTGGENRVEGEHLRFTGQSQITGPDGEIMAQADETEETVRIVELDIEKARNKQVTKRNHLFTDRHPDFYRLD